MHDIRAVRADPASFDAAMARRGLQPVADSILAIDTARRSATTAVEEARAVRNKKSREVGQLKAAGQHEEAERMIATLAATDKIAGDALARTDEALRKALAELPNRLDDDVPDGTDESDNVVLRQHGAQPNLPFTPKQHFELGEALGMMDFATAAKLAGARFTVLRGPLARLERALGQWMLSVHTDRHGYTETTVPLLVNDETMFGTGQLPKFEEDLFRTTDGRWLIPTAEVPLTNTVAGEILPEAALPVRLASLSPSFRSEAGSAGRDTRGMLRQHQFPKVEMVAITRPEDSDAEHERMTECAEHILTELGLVWRRVVLCSGDTGFSAAKTFDLEVWLPGQGAWREISSCSNTRDFQARRMNARYRPREEAGAKKPAAPAFVHTLNGSGVAVGRALIAVMEMHQAEDGSITVPEVLRPWMGGITRIAAG
ncbi:serine--tRNA ligase [Roseomonas elaeocarpi]|uniref:Serine--tRNA ligase n=1 Tax=Roseomonas elaeocarpi TaxID=907779 RepID=A0ABV6JXW1_9PROT